MDAPVLWHNVVHAQHGTSVRDSARQSYGRGLYGRKLSSLRASAEEADPSARTPADADAREPAAGGEISRRPRRLLRWQAPLAYLVIW
ncbi:MAG: hypothetical protein RLZZ450_597, partial [Pseudomonadota bacterium]